MTPEIGSNKDIFELRLVQIALGIPETTQKSLFSGIKSVPKPIDTSANSYFIDSELGGIGGSCHVGNLGEQRIIALQDLTSLCCVFT